MMVRALVAAGLLTLSLAGASQAATYDYDLTGLSGNLGTSESFMPSMGSGPGITVSAGATGLFNVSPTLTGRSSGLGVRGGPLDTEPGQIDGSPFGHSEFLTITFGWAVKLLSFGLGEVDPNDDYQFSINGGKFSDDLAALAINGVGENYVTSFVIRASGSVLEGPLGNDNFRLASIQIASVPLPAAAGLLAAALAALGLAGVARRRAV